VLADELRHPAWLHLGPELVEFLPLRGLHGAGVKEEGVPGRVLDHHADDQHQELELRRGDQEAAAGEGRGQEGLLDREAVALGPVVPQHQLDVQVHVHEAVGARIVAIVVENPGQLLPRRRPRLGEAEPVEDLQKAAPVAPVHQQVEVVLPAGGAVERRVALPVAVAD
jgi:hypothetical protein